MSINNALKEFIKNLLPLYWDIDKKFYWKIPKKHLNNLTVLVLHCILSPKLNNGQRQVINL